MTNDLRVRDDFFDLFPSFFRDFPNARKLEKSLIKVDINENDKSYILIADIPGVKKEYISVEYHNDVLTLQANRSFNKEQKNDSNKIIRSERYFGKISRQFYIENIDQEKITAQYNDGVLEVVLPKNIPSQLAKKKITIK